MSSDATLRALSLGSSVPLSPAFAADTTSYRAWVATDTLTFRLAVAAEDAGAGRARLVANGLVLNENTILDSAGRAVDTAFAVAPWVTGVALAADVSGDGAWTPGESIEVRLTFSEAVTVTVADGPPSVGVTAVAAGADAARRVEYVSGSGSATLVFRDGLTDTDGTLGRIAVTANSLALAGGRVVSHGARRVSRAHRRGLPHRHRVHRHRGDARGGVRIGVGAWGAGALRRA